jgi:uncharacterized protein
MADRDRSQNSNRGFASMDQQRQREIASKGGRASGGNFKNDPGRAATAGRKGGQSVPASERSFSRDPALAAEAGRKGGEHSRGGPGARSRRGIERVETAGNASRQRSRTVDGAGGKFGADSEAAQAGAAGLAEVAVETGAEHKDNR